MNIDLNKILKALQTPPSDTNGNAAPPQIQTLGGSYSVPIEDAPLPSVEQRSTAAIPSPIQPDGQRPVAAVPTAYDEARQNYETQLSSKANHQNPWLQGLFQGLQAISRTFDPAMQGSTAPLKWLGEAKRDYRIQQAGARLKPLEDLRKMDADRVKEYAQARKLQNDVDVDRANATTAVNREKRLANEVDMKEIGNQMYWVKKDGSPPVPIKKDDGTPLTAKDPRSQQYIRRTLKNGETVWMKGDEAFKNETEVDKYNTTATNTAERENVNNELEAQKANATNMRQYNDSVNSAIIRIMETNAGLISASPVVQQKAQDMQNLATQMQAAVDANDSEAMAKLQTAFDAKQGEFTQVLGQINGGKALVDQLKTAMPKRPAMIKPRAYKAQTIGQGKYSGQSYSNPASLQSYFPGKTPAQIKQIVEGQGGRFLQ